MNTFCCISLDWMSLPKEATLPDEELHEVLARRYDFVKNKKFWTSFLLFFCFPLSVLLPLWATNESSFVSPKKIPICIETGGGIKDAWYCVPEETAYSLVYNFGVWPPFIWFLTFGNFIFFSNIKNAYTDYIQKRHSQWEQNLKNPQNVERERIKNSSMPNIENQLEKKYYFFDPTCPRVRDICSKCVPQCKKLQFMDDDEQKPKLLKPRVCRKHLLWQILAFFTFVFIPLGVLLPIWTQDRLKVSLDIDGKTGKTAWIVCTMILPSFYVVFITFTGAKSVHKWYKNREVEQRPVQKQSTSDFGKKPTGFCSKLFWSVCTKNVIMWSFLTCLVFVLPLVVGLVCYYRAPDDFFISSMSTRDARMLLYMFSIVPPFFWLLAVGLFWTLVPVEIPERFRTKESLDLAKRTQRDLDDQLSKSLRWPRWMIYEYPYWSIGTGIVTSGERRAIRFYEGYRVEPWRFWLVWFFFFFVPIVILLPIYVEEINWIRSQDIDAGVGESTMFAFIVGYPSFFVLFHVVRLFVNVMPNAIKAIAKPAGLYFLVFVVIPLGIVEPLVVEKYIYLSKDSSLLLRAIVLGLPSSLGGVFVSVLVLRVGDWWKWVHTLRLEGPIQTSLAYALKRVLVYAGFIPLILFLYSLAIFSFWEIKDQPALTVFVVTDTVLHFLYGVCFMCDQVARIWIGVKQRVEGIVDFLTVLISIAIGFQGAAIMTKWISVAAPYIQNRVDEDDQELYVFIRYSVFGNFLLLLSYFYIKSDNNYQSDYHGRFGHHPADWELDDPSLLVRHMPTLVVKRMEQLEASTRKMEALLKIDGNYQAHEVKDGPHERARKQIRQRSIEKHSQTRAGILKAAASKDDGKSKHKPE